MGSTQPGARVAGAGRAHDTETPDVHTSSDAYRRRFTGGGRVGLMRQADGIARLMRAMGEGPLRVLDVGGGHAQLTEQLRRAGHRIVVHGSSEDCFGQIGPLTRAHPGEIAPCVARLSALPFADRTFDVVIGVRLLAHTVHWRELLSEMTRVTRRFLIVDFPSLGGVQHLSGLLFGLKRRVEENTRPFFLYRREEIAGYLETIGVRTSAWFGEFVLPLALHRMARVPRVSLMLEDALARAGLGKRFGSPVLLLGERRDAGEHLNPFVENRP